MKRRRKADFLGPIYKLQDHTSQGKRKRKKKGEKERAKRRKGGEEKKQWKRCTLSFITASLEIVFGGKKLLDAKGLYNYLAVTFSKIRLEI